MEISQIIFESNDDEVVLKGTLKQGLMSFDSETIITHTQLNQIINQLCKMNQAFAFENYLTSEAMYDGEMLYTATIPEGMNAVISVHELTHFSGIRQIRA